MERKENHKLAKESLKEFEELRKIAIYMKLLDNVEDISLNEKIFIIYIIQQPTIKRNEMPKKFLDIEEHLKSLGYLQIMDLNNGESFYKFAGLYEKIVNK